MSIKLIALGDVLRKDDGIAIYIAAELEEELTSLGVDLLYGKTDIGYYISMIKADDYTILLDASRFGYPPGKITYLPINCYQMSARDYTQHSICFLDLLKIYYPQIEGMIIAVEIGEVSFYYGLSTQLSDKFNNITKEIRKKITDIRDRRCNLNNNVG
jgi:hydrogenase maturation protease